MSVSKQFASFDPLQIIFSLSEKGQEFEISKKERMIRIDLDLFGSSP